MPVALRPYQAKLEADVYAGWNRYQGPSNMGAIAATGSGKTVLFSKFLHDAQGPSVAIAHRQELVSQMAVTLARNGVRHRIIAPDSVRRLIVSMQINDIGTGYYDPNARCAVAGVDTLVRAPVEPWFARCGLIVQDEAHHVLKDNKWGKAAGLFPNAYGLYPTATPVRADGKGLGRHADGLIDELILAPSMREIINMGYLTDYRLVLAESDVKISDDAITASGDFSPEKLREAHHASKKIVGDVVNTYLAYARGKLGITFAVDVEEATKIAVAFKAAGVPAEVVSAKTPDLLRQQIIRRFRNRELLQLVNVDLFGEGFDLPALEVVSFARHTASFSLYSQQFGRALRLMIESHLGARWDSFTDAERRAAIAASVKPRAIIIDHVGNILRHQGPPDAAWRNGKWSLDRREKGVRGKDPDADPLKYCANKNANGTGLPCAQPYAAFLTKCPHCGHAPEPAQRSTPDQVEGNMLLLDDDAAAKLRGEVLANLDAPRINPHWSPEIIGSIQRKHWDKLQAVDRLKNAAAWWAGLQNAQGYSDAEAHKKFYYKFGIDIWTAQTLDRQQAEALYSRVAAELAKFNIDATVNAGIHLLKH